MARKNVADMKTVAPLSKEMVANCGQPLTVRQIEDIDDRWKCPPMN
jgi:hypothetical protein